MPTSPSGAELRVPNSSELEAENVVAIQGLELSCAAETQDSASAGEYSPKKNLRCSYKPKRKNVRTGCLTCKVRKIKCDEEKPNCRRCSSTGRKCDGYRPRVSLRFEQKNQISASPALFRSKKASAICRAPQDLAVARKEMQTFAFVRTKTIPALSGYFSAGFWRRLLEQPNQLDPTLWHAVLAVGGFHHESEIRNVSPWQRHPDNSSQRNMAFALYHYTEAISSLRTIMASTESSLSVILTTCVLFVYLEFLRGDLETATAQIHSGLEIIRDSFRSMPAGKSFTNSDSRNEENDSLILQFYNLGVLGTLVGRPPNNITFPHGEYRPPSSSDGFESIVKARLAMVQLIVIIIPFVQTAATAYRYLDADPPPWVHSKKLELESHLESWLQAFNQLLVRLNADGPQFPGFRAAKVLLIQHTIAKIWVGAAFVIHECDFDEYTQEFAKIVALGEAVTSPCVVGEASEPQDHHVPKFSFELGIIPAIYWTAVKCRDPIIRRRAVQLLIHKTARQEGIWSAREAASIACKVIEMEEKRPWDAKLDENENQALPPESTRIRRRAFVNQKDQLPTFFQVKDGAVSDPILSKDPAAKGRYVTFEMLDNLGNVCFRREYIRYLDFD